MLSRNTIEQFEPANDSIRFAILHKGNYRGDTSELISIGDSNLGTWESSSTQSSWNSSILAEPQLNMPQSIEIEYQSSRFEKELLRNGSSAKENCQNPDIALYKGNIYHWMRD